MDTGSVQTRRMAQASLLLAVAACCGVAFLMMAPHGTAIGTFASTRPTALHALQQKDAELDEVEELAKDPEEIKKIAHEIFDKADSDGDGKLSMKELQASSADFQEFGHKYGLREPTEDETKEFIAMIPIDREEFDHILDHVVVQEEEGELAAKLEEDPEEIKKIAHEIFDKADTDKNGKLTIKEMIAANKDFQEFGEKYGLKEPSREQEKEIMDKFPLDKDEFDELLEMCLKEDVEEYDPEGETH
jgi:hypothetical protein